MLDAIITVYYFILFIRLFYLKSASSVYVINSAKYNNVFTYIFIALIIIDLIIDLVSKSKKRKEELKLDFFRLGFLSILGIVILVVQIGITTSKDSYYSGYLFSPITSNVLAEYEPISEKAGELEEKIYEKYGITVFSNLNPSDYYKTDKEFITVLETDPIKCEEYLQSIYDELAVYNDEALKIFPKHIYIVKDFINSNPVGVNFNVTSPNKGYIVMATDSLDYSNNVIHHELFHTITAYADRDVIKKFEESDESCSLTSSYACTDTVEFLADSWAYSLANGKYTTHSDILSALYPDYLRGFGSEEYTISDGNYNDIYNALEDRDLIYVKDFNKDILDNTDYLNFKVNMNLSYIYDGYNSYDAIVYRLNNDSTYQNSIDELLLNLDEIIEQFSDYTGINQLLKIYEYLKTLDITTDENITGTTYVRKLLASTLNPDLSRNHIVEDYSFRNYCLYQIMDKMGYDVHYEYYKNKDKYKMFFIVAELNGYSYVMDYSIENSDVGFLLGFMVAPDDYRFVLNTSQELNLPVGENDRSYSDYDRILLLEEFDSTLVDNYIINQCKKYRSNSELLFICRWVSIADEVGDYINNTGSKYSRVQTLYNRYVSSAIYPGYTYGSKNNMYHIYNFKV